MRPKKNTPFDNTSTRKLYIYYARVKGKHKTKKKSVFMRSQITEWQN